MHAHTCIHAGLTLGSQRTGDSLPPRPAEAPPMAAAGAERGAGDQTELRELPFTAQQNSSIQQQVAQSTDSYALGVQIIPPQHAVNF